MDRGKGYLEAKFSYDDVVVAYQGRNPLENPDRILIAQIIDIFPSNKSKVSMSMMGEGYTIKPKNELGDELERFVDEEIDTEGWCVLTRRKKQPVFCYYDNGEENRAEALFALQVNLGYVDKIRIGLKGRAFEFERNAVFHGKHHAAMGEIYSRNEEIREEAIKDVEFYDGLQLMIDKEYAERKKRKRKLKSNNKKRRKVRRVG